MLHTCDSEMFYCLEDGMNACTANNEFSEVKGCGCSTIKGCGPEKENGVGFLLSMYVWGNMAVNILLESYWHPSGYKLKF